MHKQTKNTINILNLVFNTILFTSFKILFCSCSLNEITIDENQNNFNPQENPSMISNSNHFIDEYFTLGNIDLGDKINITDEQDQQKNCILMKCVNGEDFDYDDLEIKTMNSSDFKNISDEEKIEVFFSQCIVKEDVKRENKDKFISLKDEKKMKKKIKKIKIPKEFTKKCKSYVLELFYKEGFNYFVIPGHVYNSMLKSEYVEIFREITYKLEMKRVVQDIDQSHIRVHETLEYLDTTDKFKNFVGNPIRGMCFAFKIKPFELSEKTIKAIKKISEDSNCFLMDLLENSIYYNSSLEEVDNWLESKGLNFPKIFIDPITRDTILETPVFLEGTNRFINLSTYNKIMKTDRIDPNIKLNPYTRREIILDCEYQRNCSIYFNELLNRFLGCSKRIKQYYELINNRMILVKKNKG